MDVVSRLDLHPLIPIPERERGGEEVVENEGVVEEESVVGTGREGDRRVLAVLLLCNHRLCVCV